MSYTCILAEDNLIERDIAAIYLKQIRELELVAECADGAQAAAVLAERSVDIVFSDIDMPGLSGIGLVKNLANPPVFVFITSYADYAAESFNLDVVDFIVKPVTFERLYHAAGKAVEYVQLKRVLAGEGTTGRADQQPGPTDRRPGVADSQNENGIDTADDHFYIRHNHEVTRLQYQDVAYIESMGDFSKIYLRDGEKYTTLVNLKNLEKQLPEQFFRRVHRQFIIHINRMRTVTGTHIILDNKEQIPLGSQYRQALMDEVVSGRILNR